MSAEERAPAKITMFSIKQKQHRLQSPKLDKYFELGSLKGLLSAKSRRQALEFCFTAAVVVIIEIVDELLLKDPNTFILWVDCWYCCYAFK